MAGSMSDVYEKRILDLIFRNANASATVPMGLDATNVWVGLFTATPSDTGGGTEVSGGSYARVAVARTGGGWNAATGTLATSANTAVVTFATATAPWGTVTQFGIFDAATGGNLIYWGDLTTPKTISSGDTASFAATTGLTITQD
jgi:hypothetical protein